MTPLRAGLRVESTPNVHPKGGFPSLCISRVRQCMIEGIWKTSKMGRPDGDEMINAGGNDEIIMPD